MGGPSRPNQGPAAIIGAKSAQDQEKAEQLKWMCLNLASSSFGDKGPPSDSAITARARMFYDYLNETNEGESL